MKCLIINGSPRKVNTWRIVELIKAQMQTHNDVTFDEVMLINEDIPVCRGCFTCFFKGEDKCPHNDKLSKIVEKLKDADCLILTSPVYALNISALLKNFIDHTAYFYHRPFFFDKRAIVVTTTAGGGAKKASQYLRETLTFWGFNHVYEIPITCFSANYVPSDKVKKKCLHIAEKFYKDVKEHKLKSPKLGSIVFYNLWRRLSMINKESAADKQYWEESGLVNYSFSPKVPLGIFKKSIGSMLFNLFKLIMK